MIIGAIFILFVCVLIFLLNHAYKRTNHYSNQFLTTYDIRKGVPNDIQIAVFGSTYTKFGFNSFKDLEINGFNFSLDAEPLECDSILLDQYHKHISPNAVVVFTLAACAACSKYEEVVKLNPLNYFHVMEYKRTPKCICNLKNIFKYNLPLLCHPKCIRYLLKDEMLLTNVTDKAPYICDANKRKESINSLVRVWLNMFNLSDLKSTNLPDKIREQVKTNTDVLIDIIRQAIDKGYKPALVILPLSGTLNGYFSDAFVNLTLGKMIEAATMQCEIPCLDYRKHEDFQNEESFYIDGGFKMSQIGSLHFTKIVLKDLRKLGYTF